MNGGGGGGEPGSTSNSFSEDNPKYRCCFQCMHVRTASLIIGLVHFVTTLFIFVRFARTSATIYNYTETHTYKAFVVKGANNDTAEEEEDNPDVEDVVVVVDVPYQPHIRDVVPAVLSGVVLCFSIISVVSLFWGVCRSKSVFLIPHLVVLLTTAVVWAFAALFFVVVLSVDTNELNVYVKEQMQASGYDDMPDTARFIAKVVAGVGVPLSLALLALTLGFFYVVKNCYYYLKDKERFLALETPNQAPGARYSTKREKDTGSRANREQRQPIVVIQPPSSGGDGEKF